MRLAIIYTAIYLAFIAAALLIGVHASGCAARPDPNEQIIEFEEADTAKSMLDLIKSDSTLTMKFQGVNP